MDLRDQVQATLGDAFTLEQELSGGGMSRVFVATETSLGRQIVVKVLPWDGDTAELVERFEREIMLAARLQHPHIVPLLSAGRVGAGIPYYTMPFVKGASLRERLSKSGELSVHEAVRVLRDVASALAYAHGEGVVHRDIKPDNVLISGGVAVVTDFGVAKALDTAMAAEQPGTRGQLTSQGMALGTPAYMSPEQASADPHVDNRADIYSFGIMAYELLTGDTPFATRPASRMLMAHVTEEPEPLSRRRPSVPPALAGLVMRCLEKRPSDRPQTADDIVVALDALTTPSGGSTPVKPLPQSPMGSRGRFLAVGAGLLALVIVGLAISHSRGASAEGATKSLAVIPFTSLGAEKANDYFSEGMTEEITTALTKIPGLSVAARSVAAAAAAKQPDVRAAGTALGVDAVLDGTVQRSGERVRITVHLIKVKDGVQVWSERYDRDLKDVFQVQDEIAKAIVAGLSVRLVSPSAQLVRAATGDPVAHNLVLQATYLWNRRSGKSLREAIGLFSDAVRRDPSYARGYAGLALAYAVLPDYTNIDARVSRDSALSFAGRALALDSTLVEAYTAIGAAEMRIWHNVAADHAFQRAIEVDSTFATARHWRAIFLGHVGRSDEAVAEIKRAQALEPGSPMINTNVGLMLYLAHRYPEAVTALRTFEERDPTFPSVHIKLGSALVQMRNYDEGIAEIRRGDELNGVRLVWNSAVLAQAYAAAGRTAEARALLDEITRTSAGVFNGPAGIALAYSALGDRENAIKWLQRAVDTFDPNLPVWSRDARFDALRADPRGAALFARIEAMQ
jgi:serine/threonine protein kinase/tetratricopeptide (TPR) repeat protein